jgi:hypothetical protein
MTPFNPFVVLVLLAALIGWRLYSRFRRSASASGSARAPWIQ